MFQDLPESKPDPILALIGQFAKDSNPRKIDIGVGVYKDAALNTPVMRAIKSAEEQLVGQQPTKTYLGSLGNREFLDVIAREILGENAYRTHGLSLTLIQALGGTGALRLASDLAKRSTTAPRIWMGTPTWPNHDSVFKAAGLTILTYPHTDATGYRTNLDAIMEAARLTQRDDLFLLHATCHNPTGIDLSSEELQEVFACLQKTGAVPLLDLAYAGFGDTFAADCAAVRAAIDRFDEVAVCFSCSKNFGLYRERLGALIVKSRRPSVLEGALANIARADYSQPADHAASVVNIVLRNPAFRQAWLEELDNMRARMFEKRQRLSQAQNLSPALAHLDRGKGMFALLPLKPAQCRYLREQESIYLPDNGRINIVGVPDQLEADFASAIERARNWKDG